MVLFVMKWDIHPDKTKEYLQWTKTAIPRTMSAPGVVEFRAYRAAAGDFQIITTYEFADMAGWAQWQQHEESQAVLTELHEMALNVKMELWGPSPVVPEPIRPCD